MPPAENHHDETIHFELLQSLIKSPEQSQRALAGSMGISLGKLNFCLRALIDKGWVKVDNFCRNTNKRQYGYLLTPEGVEAKARLTVRFLKRKMVEYDQLGLEIDELRQAVQADEDIHPAGGMETDKGRKN